MSAATEVVPGAAPSAGSLRKMFVATGIGNALEWYDWGIYAAYAKFIATHHFNPADPTSAVLSTLAVFAVGFVARPFGGLLLGWISDRWGRKTGLMLSVLVASLGGAIIALAPGYATIGVGASALLVIARLMQGLAHGGELPAAQTYLVEQAPPERRGLWSSWIYFSGTVGNMVGLALGAVLALVLTGDQLNDWGWRIPFGLGAVLGLYALYLRRGLAETEVFAAERAGEGGAKADQQSGQPKELVIVSIARHWKQALQVIGMTAGGTVIYYTWAINAPAYAQTGLGIDSGAALRAGLLGNLVFLIFLPIWGRLSDKVGRKPMMLLALLGGAALALPMNALLQDSAWQLAVSMSIVLAVISAFSAVGPAVWAEMFPTHVRAAGFGLPYSIAIAAFGGTAPYLQTYLSAEFDSRTVFPVYAIVLLVISAATVLTLPETKGVDLHAGDAGSGPRRLVGSAGESR